MRPIRYSYAPTALDVDAIGLLQQRVGAGALLINGANASGGVATLAQQQFPTLTSTGNLSGVNVTLTGTDENGRTISATRAGPNNNTVAFTTSFKTITGGATNGTIGTDMSIGVNGFGNGKAIPLDYMVSPANWALAVIVTGTVTYTVQHTFDDVFSLSFVEATATWFDHDSSALVAASMNQDGNYAFPPTATRIQITAGTGSVVYDIIQAGAV
jgi:hypothetical protein